MLPPGPGTPAEDVAANQRERLFGAMVASVADRGYAATRVTDLIELSGVSRKTFYALFHDKAACFEAAIEASFAIAIARAFAYEIKGGTWEERARNGFEELANMAVEQPAAARMCLVESYAAGPPSIKTMETAINAIERITKLRFDESPERAGMPDELITAFVGGTLEIVRDRLQRGTEAELPELSAEVVGSFLAYRPPPQPLRLATRPPTMAPETLDAHDHGERALRALTAVVAERGYANTTVDQIVKRASMSPTTFYAHFDGREDALMAATASAGARITAAVMPAFSRIPDWPYAVRTAYGAYFNFLASRPALARLILVEVYGGGPAALQKRSDALREVEGAMVAEWPEHAPLISPVSLEAITGGVYALAYHQVRKHGVESLAGLAPLATYFTLLPFIGAEHACEVANSDGRPPTGESESLASASVERFKAEIMQRLSTRVMSPIELASETDRTEDEVRSDLDELEERGLIERIDGPGGRYRSRLRRMGREWEEMSQPERERISTRIGHLISWEVRRSATTGTFDRRPDRHLSRIAFPVDERGWQELLEIHNRTLDAIERVTADSRERLKRSGEKPIHARSLQSLFEMPDDAPSSNEQ